MGVSLWGENNGECIVNRFELRGGGSELREDKRVTKEALFQDVGMELGETRSGVAGLEKGQATLLRRPPIDDGIKLFVRDEIIRQRGCESTEQFLFRSSKAFGGQHS